MLRPAAALALLLVTGALVLTPPAAACPDDPDLFAFSNAAFGATEGEGAAVITVTRAGASDCVNDVAFETFAAGAAVAGADYQHKTGFLYFSEGQTSATFQVTLVDDDVEEPAESFGVRLSATSTQEDLGSPTEAVVTIADDDAPTACETQGQTFRFAAAALSVAESVGAATLTVQRVGASDCAASVAYAIAPGTAAVDADFAPSQGAVDFDAGDTTAELEVGIVADSVAEEDETFTVTLDVTQVANAQSATPASATVTILDDDAAAPTCGSQTVRFARSSSEAGEAAGPVQVTVRRDGSLACAVTLSLVVAGGTASGADFTAVADQRVTMPPGVETAAAAITIVQDALDEPNETIRITLAIVAGANATLAGPAVATLWIVDDDPAPPQAPGRIALSASDLSFAPMQADGNASAPLRLNATNEGGMALGPLALHATDGFEATAPLCPPALAPGASCPVDVRFVPRARGILTGNVTVGAPGVATARVEVTGRAFEPGDLELSPAAVEVGTMFVGRTSVPFRVTVTNRGAFESGALVQVSDFEAIGDGSCGPSLQPGESCEYRMHHAGAQEIGPYRANFSVLSENLGVASVPFRALVLPLPEHALRLSPATLDFGEQPEGVGVIRAFTLTNAWPFAVRLGSPRVTGEWGPVGIVTDCESTLQPGESCPYSVRLFASTLGTLNGTLVVASDAGDSNAANLTAIAYERSLAPAVCLRPAKDARPCADAMRFDDTLVGGASAARVLVVNAGPTEAKLYSWEVEGAAFTGSNDCGSTLAAPAAGETTTCDLLVAYKPADAGAHHGILRVFTSAGGWKDLDLAGQGVTDASNAVAPTPTRDAKTPAPSALLLLATLTASALAAGRRHAPR